MEFIREVRVMHPTHKAIRVQYAPFGTFNYVDETDFQWNTTELAQWQSFSYLNID